MDKNLSLNRHYSFNVSTPAAESTRLILNVKSQTSKNFPWGVCTISPKKCNNGPNIVYNNSTVRDYKVKNVLRTSPRSQNSISKIDSRIFADVQSMGLASRIVKYHENESRLNRSMSAHKFYIKPGQFPVVNLNKTQLPLRATKQSLSMTRIAPPDKPVFHGNTISSLLRSSSVVGIHKSDEEISRENRPIIHPPPTENDMAPTRSVLEVLKEISRKRINNEDPTLNETNKKYCERSGNDSIDVGGGSQLIYQNQDSISTQSFKRQRDASANYCRTAITSGSSSSSNSQLWNTSPEQAKKRLCSYNNDITSSLSSSMKRKFYDPKNHSVNINRTSPTCTDNCDIQKKKIQKQQNSFEMKNNDRSKTANNDIKSVTIQDEKLKDIDLQRNISERSSSYPNTEIIKDRKQLSENIESNKPRLTLFNKTYEENNADTALITNVDSDDYAGIQFVKPKKINTITYVKNPIIERTQKSKLALMLCGLKGEIYKGHNLDFDTNDGHSEGNGVEKSKDRITGLSTSGNAERTRTAAVDASSTVANSLEPVSAGSISTAHCLITPTSTVVASVGTPIQIPAAKPIATPIVSSSSIVAKKSPSTSSPLVGIKLTPQNFTSSSNTTTVAAEANVSDDVIKQPTLPRLGGFYFDINAASNKAATTTTTTEAHVSDDVIKQPTLPRLGGFHFDINAALNKAATTTTTTEAHVSDDVTKLSTLPRLGGFDFDINAASNKAATTTTTTEANVSDDVTKQPTLPRLGGFHFDINAASNQATTTTTTTTEANVSDDVKKLSTLPRLGGFNFDINAASNKFAPTTTTTITTINITTQSTSTSSLTGIKLGLQNFNTFEAATTTTASTASNPAPNLSTSPRFAGFNINSGLNADINKCVSNNPVTIPTATATTTTTAATSLNAVLPLSSADTLKLASTGETPKSAESLIINSNALISGKLTPNFSFGHSNQMTNTTQSLSTSSNLFMNNPSNPVVPITHASLTPRTTFTFGSKKPAEPEAITTITTATTKAFNFNAKPNTTVSAPIASSVFSNAQTTMTAISNPNPTFFFDKPTSNLNTTTALATTTTPSDGFSFGSAQSVVSTKPATGASQPNEVFTVPKAFTFGTPATSTTNSENTIFGFLNNSPSNTKPLYASTICTTTPTTTTTITTTTATTTTTSSSLSNLTFQSSKPIFGSSSPLSSQTASISSNNSSIFGSALTNQKAVLFGSSNNPLATKKDEKPSFDPTVANKPSTIFGSSCSLFTPKKDEIPTFGSNTVNQASSFFSSQNNPMICKKEEKASMGSTAGNDTTTIFRTSNNPPFSSVVSNQNHATFGSPNSLSLAKSDEMPSFGSTAVNQTSSPFGIANSQSVLPMFGSNADKPTVTTPFAFGSSTSANSGTFAFGNQPNNTLVSSPKTENASFASLSASNLQSQNKAFSFGNGGLSANLFGNNAKSNETPGKGFSFRGTTTESAANIFASPATVAKTTATTTTATFNTGSAAFRNASASDGGIKSTSNAFGSPTPAMERPIRRATRRLQK
uniref:Uncharacterized protein n=1 Tax=Glossina brevipalpis TaxID=37001 RepID=A0A1A9WDD9_9MUSC